MFDVKFKKGENNNFYTFWKSPPGGTVWNQKQAQNISDSFMFLDTIDNSS